MWFIELKVNSFFLSFRSCLLWHLTVYWNKLNYSRSPINYPKVFIVVYDRIQGRRDFAHSQFFDSFYVIEFEKDYSVLPWTGRLHCSRRLWIWLRCCNELRRCWVIHWLSNCKRSSLERGTGSQEEEEDGTERIHSSPLDLRQSTSMALLNPLPRSANNVM